MNLARPSHKPNYKQPYSILRTVTSTRFLSDHIDLLEVNPVGLSVPSETDGRGSTSSERLLLIASSLCICMVTV